MARTETTMRIKSNQKRILYRHWTQAEIIQLIKDRVRQKLSLHAKGIQKDNPNLYAAAWRKFGRWRKACQSAKVSLMISIGRKPKWSQEKLLAALRAWYQQHPSPPPKSSKSYKHFKALWITVARYFPSRNSAREKLGLPLIRSRRWTAAKVIKELQDRFRRGQPINTMALLKEKRFLYTAARRKFGSFRAAARAAGFDFEAIRSPIKAWHFTKKKHLRVNPVRKSDNK